ncbi:MAG: efflux transporter outer membrane subunit [Chlorobiaceae bacterium]|nr:efflux transporter outer membrane subunit [Chlorobiaceae bacterium]NTV24806.1 efflux transporter outer membrane subunit [Chlorobiaceae bacterium]
MPLRFRHTGIACCLMLLMLSGCSAGPDFVRPAEPQGNRYDRNGTPWHNGASPDSLQRFAEGAEPSPHWWRAFRSKQIDSVMTSALAGNPGLQSAQASLRQSQENIKAGAGIFFPQVNASLQQSRGNSTTAGSGSVPTGSVINLSTLTASVSYALDLFGGQRRTVEGLRAQVDQQQALTLGTWMMLSGNIVNTSIAIAAYREEIGELEQLIAIEKEQLSIAENQYRSGLTDYSAVLAMKSQLESLEASLPPVRRSLSQSEHLLATLVGKSPSEWQVPELKLTEIALPDRLPLSLPSELVRQRPDILAAEAQLHAANANIGIATAAMLPSFTLTGNYGRSSGSMDKLLDGSNLVWGIGAGVVQPLFNGGTLAAKRRAAIAGRDRSLADYRQTVLSAFAQVADLLRALEEDANLARSRARAVNDAGLSLKLIQTRYKAGLADYLQVIMADIQYRQSRIGQIQAQALRLQDSAALYVALGGGWQHDHDAKGKAGLK